MSKPFRILSLDGGGIRGLLTAQILLELDCYIQANFNQQLSQYFELIAGASAGAILASEIAVGKTTSDIIKDYICTTKKIFFPPSNPLKKIDNWLVKTLFGLSSSLFRPKHSGSRLTDILKSRLGVNRKIADLDTKLLILAYETQSHRPIIFNNWVNTDQFEASNWIYLQDIFLWEAVRCSSSFPGFFPAYPLQKDGKLLSVIDGSIGALNPAAVAVAAAIAMGHKPENINLLSIGSGDPNLAISLTEAETWGMTQWASRMFNLFTFGVSSFDDYIAGEIANVYLRLQPKLTIGSGINDVSQDYDDTSDKNTQNLITEAQVYLRKDEIQKKLTNFFCSKQN
ncbi:MAG: patatin-like phospholipase family protein [Symploca sp. SIO1C4]|uniref:Patatin-like phospholipase family protein n=1 Tax=Symploca sp. SIO1C4 TaxID=2607765 RepID=A0A6B3N4S4_9CYAN|nr:patatin-like phospholipase family protein [Symploca sp. SIO1C4]